MLLDFNYYLILPHHYAINDIHYILLTPLEKDIVYVLPSHGYGFDAVYCPQLELEQAVVRAALRKVILACTQQVKWDEKITNDLAYWLYWYRCDAKLTLSDTTVPAAPNNQTPHPAPKGAEPEEGPKAKLHPHSLIGDAMEVASQLGYNYLWVDRYCIP